MNSPRKTQHPLQGEIAGYDTPLTLEQLCRSCQLPQEEILLLVEEGIIEPQAADKQRQSAENWQFHWTTLTRVRTSARLQRDLGVNLPGVALALELLERIERLERQLQGQ